EESREAPARGRGDEVARRVVERLGGQGERARRRRRPLPRVRDADAHLHEAVEAAPRRPGPREAVGVVEHAHDARVFTPEPRAVESETVEGVRAVPRDDHMRGADEIREHGVARWLAEVERGGALAGRRLREQGGYLLEPRRIEAEDVRAPRGEKPRSDRTRDDPSEVEHAHAVERAPGRGELGWRGGPGLPRAGRGGGEGAAGGGHGGGPRG